MTDTYKVEIHETWVKTLTIEAESRVQAVAKAEAGYVEEFSGAKNEGIAYDYDSVRRVEFKLAWPDGK